MKRRTALKQLMIIGGAVTVMPSCFRKKSVASIRLRFLSVNSEQEKLLSEISETIIPATDTPGGKELGVHLFALKMMDDCANKDSQQSFMKGLEEMVTYCKVITGKSFIENNQQQRTALIVKIDKDNTASKDLKFFSKKMRQLTIEGYTTSKYVMTELIPYQLVPGHFNGCVNKNKLKKANNG